MNNIEWEDGAVCYADGQQWFTSEKIYLTSDCSLYSYNYENIINCDDFQLSEPSIGDYIPKSELGTEKKYNDAVEELGLFGFEPCLNYEKHTKTHNCDYFFIDDDSRLNSINKVAFRDYCTGRKLTHNQLMAIGKLKRLMNERDNLKRCGEYSGCVKVDLGDVKEKEVAMQKNKPVVAQVMIDLTERMEIGIKTYGEALRASNGRDALQDAYEEALDLACYLKQAMIERDNANTN